VNAIASERDPQPRKDSLRAILGQLASESKATGTEPTAQALSALAVLDENDGGIVRLVTQMITDAYQQGASDIHLEPYGEDKKTLIRFRVDGRCHDYLTVVPPYRRLLASRLKVMANLDISERRKPQDGKITFRLADREIELRVTTIPTAGNENEDVTLRILAASESLPLDKIQLTASNLRAFQTILEKPYGLILCVGPTGSGKTTTLHSALGHINTPDKKVWTAEDPVEITQYGLRQVQVRPKIGFTFATAMRAFLRADPDVIMVGEIRDQETAQIGIEASLTGHLILSTVHTNSAPETITRLIEMGMDPFHFADALLGILAQRLARTICRACKEPYHPSRGEYQALAAGYGEEAFAQLDIPYDGDFKLYRGRGCEACQQTGYKGRMGIHELLITTDTIKSRIHARATAAELRHVARDQGMTTLVQDGIGKVLQGWMDYSQVKAVAIR
jgi:type II secretory ATPase GspE/PulE/Tfp pilus assembly ATPase PilB-like protein